MERYEDVFETSEGVRLGRTVYAGGRRAGVLLIHGMAEHRGRYAALAEALAADGALVWAYDQRGHGRSAPDAASRRHIAPGNDWRAYAADARELLAALEQAVAPAAAPANTATGDAAAGAAAGGRAPAGAPPLFALGHSMGSLVLREVLRDAPVSLCGAVLMGTAGPGGAKARVGHLLAAAIAAFRPAHAPSQFLNDMTFGAYNKAVAGAVTAFDWLSRDEDEVRRYIEDPDCGEVMSAHFYRELTRGIVSVSSQAALAAVSHETALLLYSGGADPVGEHGRGVEAVGEELRRAGHPKVEVRLRDGARHELLHETDRGEVIADLVRWVAQRRTACQTQDDTEK